MAITQEPCNSFKLELVQGIHDFSSDTIKIALYTSSATLNKDTTAYSATNEASGTGYSAGGATMTLTSTYPKIVSDAVEVRFDTVTWSSADFTCRGALIYNSSKANRAIHVIDFGNDVGPSGGNFSFYAPVAAPAIVKIT